MKMVEKKNTMVLFYWNLSRLPFLGQVTDLDLLLCTGFYLNLLFEPCVDLFLCPIFTSYSGRGSIF